MEPLAPVRPDASVLPESDASVPSSLGPILDVPEGEALEGQWFIDVATKTIRPEDSCRDGSPKRFWVAGFRLMKWEVTNGAYKGCVLDGACVPPDALQDPGSTGNPDPAPWDSPEKANKPAAVNYPAARVFCRHYGGDVVTNAQWDRAVAGDTSTTFGIAPVTAAFLRCLDDQRGNLCDEIGRSSPMLAFNLPPFALREVGTTPWDVGPYGHQDLFANAEEWTRTAELFPGADAFCALPDDSPDPIAVSPELTVFQTVRQPAAVLERLAPLVLGGTAGGVGDSKQRPLVIFPWRKVGEGTYFTGFRCAFPR